MTGRPTALYRFFAADGALLYVGISLDISTRLHTHRGEKPDWQQVTRIDLTWYDSRADALRAEAQAIRTENPRWNVSGTDRPVQRRPSRSADAAYHREIMRDVMAMIESGHLKPGQRLPTTAALVQTYGHAAATVRQAITSLVKAGVLRGHQGVGVFVAER